MTQRTYKAYYLKKIEFKILLAIKGVKELYGFFLGEQGKIKQSEMNRQLFEMAKKEIVVAKADQLVIHPELDAMLNHVMNARQMLVLAEKSAEHPEYCIYIDSDAVGIQIYGQENQMVRIERIALCDLPEWIVESGFRIEQILTEDALFREEEVICREISEIADNAFGKEKNEILKQEGIYACLQFFDALSRKKKQQILLLSNGLEDYIAINGKKETVYAYSGKKTLQVVGQCIGGEE